MIELVVTVLGRDRAGLVGSLSGVVARHGANWEQASMAELAGVFAGVVLVRVSPGSVDGLMADLDQLESDGMLRLEVERAPSDSPGSCDGDMTRYRIEVTGQDHPGIVHDITRQLGQQAVSIESFTSEVTPAPLGGQLFTAALIVQTPTTWSADYVQQLVEDVASDLIVDVDMVLEDSAA